MSVRFDLTVVAPELLDSVVSMDNSPAYDAFRTEIEAITADFSRNSHFGSSITLDEKALTENCGDTLRNMHESFFIWLCRDEQVNGRNVDSGYSTYLKLFFKSNCDRIATLNGGNALVAPEDIAPLKERFIAEIGKDPSLYKSLKDFFAGYVYGYFFNFLTEQKVMSKYAEFLVCIGIMTGKITSSVSAQQKILLKMAGLLSDDRMKYVSGFIPLDVITSVIYSRFAFPAFSDADTVRAKGFIKDYLTSHYELQTDDENNLLISAGAVASAMTGMHGKYTSSAARAAEIYEKCFSGDRTGIDGKDTENGSFSAAVISSAISSKCSAELAEYFTSDREPNLDVSLESGTVGYKYPLIFKDGDDYCYSSVYSPFVDEILVKMLYVGVEESRLPVSDFPFIRDIFSADPLRKILGSQEQGFTVRKDKELILSEISQIRDNSMLTENDRKMFVLEKLTSLISGNCTAEEFRDVIDKNIFASSLYDEYIRFRVNRLCEKGIGSIDEKKKLLQTVNELA